MASIVNIGQVGNTLVARLSSGGTRTFYSTSGGIWVPTQNLNVSTPTGAGESGAIDTGSTTNVTPGSVGSPVDDYPWPNAPEDGMSPLRYSFRDCTDFVAWRINRDAGVTHSPWKWTWGNLRWQGAGGNGDAIGWRADWIRYGRAVDITPKAGCIGWHGTGQYGHVFYVQAVSGGNMTIEQYNIGGSQAYSTVTVPIEPIDSTHSYLAMPT